MASKQRQIRTAIEQERQASNQRIARRMTHSRVWSDITDIAAKQCGCHYRSVKVADNRFDPREKSKLRPGFRVLNAGQEAMVNNPDVVKAMSREWEVCVPLPSEVKDSRDPFDHARFDHAMITEPE